MSDKLIRSEHQLLAFIFHNLLMLGCFGFLQHLIPSVTEFHKKNHNTLYKICPLIVRVLYLELPEHFANHWHFISSVFQYFRLYCCVTTFHCLFVDYKPLQLLRRGKSMPFLGGGSVDLDQFPESLSCGLAKPSLFRLFSRKL